MSSVSNYRFFISYHNDENPLSNPFSIFIQSNPPQNTQQTINETLDRTSDLITYKTIQIPAQFKDFDIQTINSMSISEDKVKLIDVTSTHQESFFRGYEEDSDIPPTELSGDENASQSIAYSAIDGGNKANFLLTVTTIIKTVIGSGILGLPYTVSQCGWVFALLVFVVATIVTQLGSVLLLRAKNLSGHSNYSTIFYHIYQNRLCKSVGSIVIFLNNLGICILEIIIFKNTVRSMLVQTLTDEKGQQNSVLSQFYTSPIFIALVICFLQIPSIMVKKIERLRFMAFLGVSGIMVFVITFVIYYIFTISDFKAQNNNPPMEMFPTDWFKAIASIPTLLLALSFHMNFFPVYKGMRNANDKKMLNATVTGISVCSVSYLLIGVLGYHLVHTINNAEIKSNFLQSITYKSTPSGVYFVLHAGFLLSIFFAFPIMFFGCRNNFMALAQLLLKGTTQKRAQQWRENSDHIQHMSSYIQSQDRVQRRKQEGRKFIGYTITIFLVIMGVGVGVYNIQVVFNIVGAVCSTSIGVLLPCLFYCLLVRKKNKPKKLLYYVSIGVFIIMLPFAIFSIVAEKLSQ